MPTVGELLQEAESAFRQAAFENPAHEAAYLLGARLSCSPAQLTLRRAEPAPTTLTKQLRSDLARRLRREPSDHIIGWKDFLGQRFAVDARVLVPRPETELLAGEVALIARTLKKSRILDVGTGSGCIAITVALGVPGAEITAVDLSPGALALARSNAEALGARSVRFFQSDLFNGLPPENRGYFDIIVSNPPYVPTKAVKLLEPELAFEPQMALDGGPDGLSIVRRLVSEAPAFLASGGRLLTEIGWDQGPRVEALLKDARFSSVRILKDLEEKDRIASGVFIGPV